MGVQWAFCDFQRAGQQPLPMINLNTLYHKHAIKYNNLNQNNIISYLFLLIGIHDQYLSCWPINGNNLITNILAMKAQQNENVDVISKPKILIAMFVIVSLQFAVIVTIFVLQVLLGYIGFDSVLSSDVIYHDTQVICNNQYINSKYIANTNHYLSVGFIAGCLSLLCTLILCLFFMRIATKKINTNENNLVHSMKNRSKILSLFIGLIISRFVYLLQSIAVLGSVLVFGVYLGFYIELPIDCYFFYEDSQILAIMLVSGVLIFVSVIFWGLVVYIGFQIKKQMHEEQDKQQNKLININREQTYADLHSQTKEKESEDAISCNNKKEETKRQSVYTFKKNESQSNKHSFIYIDQKQNSNEDTPDNNQKNHFRDSQVEQNRNNYRVSNSQYHNQEQGLAYFGGNAHEQKQTDIKQQVSFKGHLSRKQLYQSPYRQIEKKPPLPDTTGSIFKRVPNKRRGILTDYIHGKSPD